jgi:hypothetical protein
MSDESKIKDRFTNSRSIPTVYFRILTEFYWADLTKTLRAMAGVQCFSYHVGE